MKVQALLLGYFSDQKPVYVYGLRNSTTLLFKLSDISLLFGLAHLPQHPSLAPNLLSNSPHCYRDHQDLYLTTKLVSETAISLNKYLLAEFCKLKPSDYTAGLADSILNSVPRFERVQIGNWIPMDLPIACSTDRIPSPPSRSTQRSTSSNNNDRKKSSPLVKTEPLSPSFVPASPGRDQNNPMAINTVLTNGDRCRSGSAAEDQQPVSSKRQRVDNESTSNKKRQSLRNVLPKPMHTVSSQSSSGPSTLFSKRLLSKQGKNARNLTIFAPSYSNQPALGIRSAPLNSNFFQQQQQQPPGQQQPPTTSHQLRQQHHPPTTANGQQGHKGYYQYAQAPSTSLPQSSQPPRMGMLHPGHTLAPLLSPRAPLPSQRENQRLSPRNRQEFAIPPIVPSQQQPPLSAHPSSSYHHTYMASPMYQRNTNSTSNNCNNQPQQPATAALPTTASAVPLPPQTPTTNGSLQRQQFLQPFEHLFETIETSRTLKSTLDDQIRRSSTLMQTLQASSTTIEGLVRNQIKEAQKEMMVEMDAAFESILGRIEKLERVAGKHPEEDKAEEPTPKKSFLTLVTNTPALEDRTVRNIIPIQQQLANALLRARVIALSRQQSFLEIWRRIHILDITFYGVWGGWYVWGQHHPVVSGLRDGAPLLDYTFQDSTTARTLAQEWQAAERALLRRESAGPLEVFQRIAERLCKVKSAVANIDAALALLMAWQAAENACQYEQEWVQLTVADILYKKGYEHTLEALRYYRNQIDVDTEMVGHLVLAKCQSQLALAQWAAWLRDRSLVQYFGTADGGTSQELLFVGRLYDAVARCDTELYELAVREYDRHNPMTDEQIRIFSTAKQRIESK
ncbi:hypothetical protein BJV82DRAFT_583021 [Fennellomyces sp. T-0311]|nr:hypothetical protein BJV82DRAFT_583021 [Fennellomyces sp. T-0311]